MTRQRVVVTAGPTHEHLDPVRYLGNESSGRMGFELARAAAAAGHRVTLVAGPVHQDTPTGVRRVDVVSAREMLAAVKEAFADADALYMAAAVADWRPRRRRAGKWRKDGVDGDTATLELVKNPDILKTVARRKAGRFVVGFALETGDGLRRARAKLTRKGVDAIVCNDASVLGRDRTTATVVFADGREETFADVTKRRLARALVGLLPPRRARG